MHKYVTRWAAMLFDATVDKLIPYLDGWKQYPPQWTGNGDDYVGKHRR